MKVQAVRVANYHSVDRQQYCYYKNSEGTWNLYIPGVGLGNLAGHQVVENPDGTITVDPSIRVWNGSVEAHGHLIQGVWEDC